MAHAIPDQNPGHKLDAKTLRNRRVVLLGLVGVAALALLLGRRGSPAAAPQGQSLDQPSTFADNGGQAAQLGDDVSGQLGTFGLQMGDLTSAVQGLTDVVNTPRQAADASPDTPQAQTIDPAAQAGQLLAAWGAGMNFAQQHQAPGSPSGSRSPGAVQPKTIVKPSAAHGGALGVYHVTPGHAPVYVRAASSAARKSKGSPAGKHTTTTHHTTSHPASKKKRRR
jgi:hypothetical protein